MDIEYLLLLQHFREGPGAFLAPFMNGVSKLAVGFVPVAMACVLYWALDRKAGRRILAGFGLGLLANGFLKLVCCVYRPWIRDARVEPYGDSKVAATGYSFPSGHSTMATALFGGTGLWANRKKGGWRWFSFVLFALVLLTLFSRNYLGVHTPQDVVVGFASTALMMYISCRIEDWTDADPSRDTIVAAGGILLCIALALFYTFKSYPLTYLADGSLLVDPVKMRGDSFEGIGFVSSFVVCRWFERRGPDFEKELAPKPRFLLSLIALIPLFLWLNVCCPWLMVTLGRSVGRFLHHVVLVFYTFILVPWSMHFIAGRLTQRAR